MKSKTIIAALCAVVVAAVAAYSTASVWYPKAPSILDNNLLDKPEYDIKDQRLIDYALGLGITHQCVQVLADPLPTESDLMGRVLDVRLEIVVDNMDPDQVEAMVYHAQYGKAMVTHSQDTFKKGSLDFCINWYKGLEKWAEKQ